MYVDASVLLRVILDEPDALSGWASISPISSELIRVECLRAIDRAHRSLRVAADQTARHRSDVLEALRTFRLVPISAPVVERAADPFPTPLGSLDAIHLATAIELRTELPTLEFSTHDLELATAARAVGFAVAGA